MPPIALLAPTGSADLDPADVAAGRYAIDPAHTRVLFGISHFGFSTFFGEFPNVSGALVIDPAAPANGQLRVSAPVSQVSTGNQTLNAELRSDVWLDADRFPEVTFQTSRIEVLARGGAEVTGAFTLHGVSRPLTLAVALHGAGINPVSGLYNLGFDVRGRLRRSDFGVMAELPMIGDEIDLIISAAFVLQA